MADFGLAKILENGVAAKNIVGTREYFAPELLRREQQTFALDWWTLGVLVYEMCFGKTPFKKPTKEGTKNWILIGKPILGGKNLSEDCKDFITKLLDKNPTTRLGAEGDLNEVLAHPWVNEIDI